MVKKVNQNPTYRANRQYHGHDLSQHTEFTSTVGQLLPVYHDILNPGEKIRLQTYLKTRTQPLSANTFTRINEYIEWYFVPINQIYKPFGNWFYGVQDFDTSLFGGSAELDRYDPKLSLRLPFLTAVDFRKLWVNYKSESYRTLKGEHLYSQFVRLLTHLGINDTTILDTVDNSCDGPYWSITPILLCAYQKIFMDHYRDSNRIENDPRCYNMDRFWEDTDSIVTEHGEASLFHMMQMRYRPVKKDFYTNTFPSPVFGAGSIGAQGFNGSDQWQSTLDHVNQWLSEYYPKITNSAYQTNVSVPTQVVETGGVISPAIINSTFAMQKLLEVTRRSGKHYDAQTLAHFGVQVPDSIEGQSSFLGRHQQQIIVGDVISTADTSSGDIGQPLGEIAGKGYSAENSQIINFEAPCHGILMGIYSAAPDQEYFEQGLDRLNCLINKEDWYIPEYDNLGMQPQFGYQTELADNTPDNSKILGWQYRYMELKQKPNRIITGLKHSQKHWTAGCESSKVSGTDASNYYVSPGALDSAMLYSYNFGFSADDPEGQTPVSTSSELFQSDPLIHDLKVDVKKASQMSTYGLLEL